MPMPAGAVPLSFDTGAMVGAATGSGTGPNQATRLPVPNPSRPELLPHEAQMYRYTDNTYKTRHTHYTVYICTHFQVTLL